MIIVIDGYNVLKQRLGSEVSEIAREQFILQLGQYARIKKHAIIVVFDGGPSEWVSKEKKNGITVVYSGSLISADECIKEYLRQHAHKDLLLVSTDRELNAWATRFGLPSMDAADFYLLFLAALKNQSPQKSFSKTELVKLSDKTDEELDRLMREAAVVVPEKSVDVVRHEPKDSSHKPSKAERSLLKIVKKL